MIRAGVFIGVDKTGNLQMLADAAAGARRMYEWALTQGIDPSNATLITDETGPVGTDQIYNAINHICSGPGVDQLILYYAGHGVNINRSEQWLLTDAPTRTSAAVNVAGSVELARYCGIQHVVLISDACRVAPEGIQSQNVRGVDIFPNAGISDRAKPVDQFFACLLGRTAAEIADPVVAARNYSALYTGALLDALNGSRPDILDPSGVPTDESRYIRLRRLESYLESEVPVRVRRRDLQQKVNQNPDAIITSDNGWLARFEPPTVPVGASPHATRSVDTRITRASAAVRGPPSSRYPSDQLATRSIASNNLRSVADRLVHSTIVAGGGALETELKMVRATDVLGAEDLARGIKRIANPFGPDHFETGCGIKVRGARIRDFLAPQAIAQPVGPNSDLIRIDGMNRAGANVLLSFDNGSGTVIPVIQGFIAALTFDGSELVDVAYEPSRNDWRWEMFAQRASEVRGLRAVAASASQYGRFRLDQPDAAEIARRMQYAKGIDPTLSVYAAYAYNDLQDIERIRAMSGYLRDDIGVTLFDVALLGRELTDKSILMEDAVVPFVPLLSQGWALLGANRVRLHRSLEDIQLCVQDSLWSLYDEAGVAKLANALQSGSVR